MAKTSKIPATLSLQRATVISDGAFFNHFDNGENEPLRVMYHGIRGTQNVSGNKGKGKGAAAGQSVAREVSNIQQTESAKLAPNAKLLVTWDFRLIDLSEVLFACASGKGADKSDEQEFRKNFQEFVNRAKESDGLKTVVQRYVRNIVNGRWLWRNRVVAEDIQIRISQSISSEDKKQNEKQDEKSKSPTTYRFNALDFDLRSFDNITKEEEKLAEILLAGVKGYRADSGLHIEAIVDFGMGGVEVFPSQNYLEEKTKGFSRSLYQLNPVRPKQTANDNQFLGQAALRDQKIGNAIRTIDTWYPKFEENYQKPIAVEPNGANLEDQLFYRLDKDSSAFEILKEIDTLDPNSEKGMFFIACLIRGGVYTAGD